MTGWSGTVRGLFVAAATSAPMQSREEVTIVAGVGIEGDRYAAGTGHFSPREGPGQELTLVEEESIEALRRDYGIDLGLAGTRRNVVTSGVPLNHLVGRDFRIGPVVARGVRLAEPCSHLAALTGVPGLREALVHRGGLRADVVTGGVVRVGDPVELVS